MSPVVTKTYTPLSEIPKANVGKCTAVLPNHMQCWRAGDMQVSIATVDGDKASQVYYQLCFAHARQEQQQDATQNTEVTEVQK